MVAYATALLTGTNLLDAGIKGGTAKKYMYEAIRLSTKAIPPLLLPYPDPTLDETGECCEELHAIWSNQARYEGTTDRQHPLTKAMVTKASATVRAELHSAKPGPTRLTVFLGASAAMRDWGSLGLSARFRQCEWAQKTQQPSRVLLLDHTGKPYAKINKDFRWYGPDGRRILCTPRTVLTDIASFDMCWRQQKNKDNGQWITYHVNPTTPMYALSSRP